MIQPVIISDPCTQWDSNTQERLIEAILFFDGFRRLFNESVKNLIKSNADMNALQFQDKKIELGRRLMKASVLVYKEMRILSGNRFRASINNGIFSGKRNAMVYTHYCLNVYKRAVPFLTRVSCVVPPAVQFVGQVSTLICADFIVPVTPAQYSAYASSLEYRHEWDSQLDTVRHLESVTDHVDICYVSLKAFGAIAPRDCINLRVIKTLADEDIDFIDQSDLHKTSCSCSCSIEYPIQNPKSRSIRADIKIACYFVEPCNNVTINTSHLVWSKVYLFCDVDPCGWIPASTSKHISVKVLPRTVERIITSVLKHYGIDEKKIL